MQKADANAFINQLLVYTLVMLVFTGSVGLGTVWLRHEISLVANRNRKLQVGIAEVQQRVDEYTAEIAAAQGADNLIRLNSQWRLGLVQPRPEQSEYVAGNIEQWLVAQRSQNLFTAEVQPVIYRRGGLR
jgi:hypothetical protein